MKRFLTLYLVLTCGICFAQKKLPCEAGEKGSFYNKTQGENFNYTIVRNDPYAIPKSGLDFKGDVFFSKYCGFNLGVSRFKRPAIYRESRIDASLILGDFSDSTYNSKGKRDTSLKIMYTAGYRYTWFFNEHIKRSEEDVAEKVDGKHNYNWRIDNQCLVKKLIQYGFSLGTQVYAGNFHVNMGVNNTIPFETVVYSASLERRRSESWGYTFYNRTDTTYNFWVSGSYLRFLFSPVFYSNYVVKDGQTLNKPVSLTSHFGFTIGAYMDFGGAFQGTFETGIMPSLGWYFKLG
ncbi:MAG TPA: hypothetical protein VNZ49_01340 [Bacteroidia bacterium]|jgi:hypothetical protein|nr:hypothetical protein [Bacteroidia bacterium]